MGAESGSQRVLDAMDKGTRVEEIYEARENLRRHGIRACFFLQFGYPGEAWDARYLAYPPLVPLFEALVRVLEPFGIKELVQSGAIAVGRGGRSITDRTLRPLERSA